jgi:hypothetical protein
MGEKIADRRASGRVLMRERSLRLLVPFLFAALVIVPPQSWVQLTEMRRFSGGYLEFWGRYLSGDQSFGIFLPTYNHMWFVGYLWLYTMVAAMAWTLMPWLDRALNRLMTGPGLFLFPIAGFMALRALVYPRHPETIILWDDLYAHLHFGFAFALGLGLAKMDKAWARFVDWRHYAAAGALIIALFSPRLGFHLANGTPVGLETHLLRSTYAWLVIAALFGYAYRSHLRLLLDPRLWGVPILFRGDSHGLCRRPGPKSQLAALLRRLLFRLAVTRRWSRRLRPLPPPRVEAAGMSRSPQELTC